MFDIEAGFTTAQSERTKEMDEFFTQVDEVKRTMAAIKGKQREIQRMHEQSKTIVRKADMQQHRAEVQVRGECGCVLRLELSSTRMQHRQQLLSGSM